ncbi:hypothetical protein CQA01_36890 [Cyclobacterium qasimii]|uniref:Uncharacterized protein n=1 Tax=Cyclobacterium qasimii TaxID=1350429 RepID=A0A512CG54_9BACT|nr:hypothetical protein CQA01_36890 [Cyclobacterium qasimii]
MAYLSALSAPRAIRWRIFAAAHYCREGRLWHLKNPGLGHKKYHVLKRKKQLKGIVVASYFWVIVKYTIVPPN